MKSWGWIALGVLLLAGCTPVETAPQAEPGGGNDPYAMRDAANAAIQSTARAKAEQDAQATQQAAKDEQKTKRQIDLLMAPITATAAALELQATAGEATQQAAIATATQQAANTTAIAVSSRATETREAEVSQRSFEQTQALAWNIFWGFVVGGGTIAGIYIAYILIKKWEDEKIKRERERLEIEREQAEAAKRRDQLVFPGNGEVWWIGPKGPMKLEGASKAALASTVPYSVSGDGLIPFEKGDNGKNGTKHDTNSLARLLVDRSIREWGDNSDHLAGWRLIGWNPSKWQRLMRALDADGLIESMKDETDSNKKKIVLVDSDRGGYANLRALSNALASGNLILHPAPNDTPLPYSDVDD